jgi:hypothetical protein
MATATSLSSTRRMVRALRRTERLTDTHAALATLALTTAGALDDVVASDEKRYVVAQFARAHLLALGALLDLPEPAASDAFDDLLRELTRPGPGAFDADDGRL